MPWWKGNNYTPNTKQNKNSKVTLTSFNKLPSIRKKDKKDSLTVQFKSNLSNSKSKSKKLGCLG